MRDYAVLMAIAASLPFILYRPWVGILVWSWVGYMNPHKLGWGLAAHMPIAMVVGGFILVGLFFTKDRKAIPWNGVMVTMLLMALLFTVTSLFAWAPDAAWEKWKKVIKVLLMTFIIPMLIFGKYRIRLLMLVIALSIGFYGFKGGLFSLLSGGSYKVWGPEASFIGGNTEIGLAMIMVLPLLMALAKEESHRWLKYGLYSVFWLTVVATVFTYSRGALLGLITVMGLLFLSSQKKLLILAILVPTSIVAVQLLPSKLVDRTKTIETFEQDNSAMQRLQAWSVGWNVALERPLNGAGFAMEYASDEKWISYASFLGDWHNRARAFHSIYFSILGEHGFLGLGLFLLLLILSIRMLSRIRRQEANKERTWIGSYADAIRISIIGYAVSGAFLSLAYFDLFYAYIALSAILAREANTEKEQEVGNKGLAQTGDRPHRIARRTW